MACTSPLYRIPEDSSNFHLLPVSDKKRLRNGGVFIFDTSALCYYQNNVQGFNIDDVQVLRCGQCIDCRLNYSRDWAIRCSLEAADHEHNYFVTLTYDDFSIPRGEFVDYKGEIYDTNLCKRDMQLFIKSYREWERVHNNNTGIKVFYCGEYGSTTSRPHYHLCIFGATEIPDLMYNFTKGQYKYYKSKIFESFWSDNKILKGFVDITECSFDSIAYTARYCLKKQQGRMKKDFLDYYSSLQGDDVPDLRLQPFICMSRRPGIASAYYERNKQQIRSEDLVKFQKKYQLFTSKPPRYFDKLFDRDDPESFSEVKERRRIAGLAARHQKNLLVAEDLLGRELHEAQINEAKEKRYYVRGL